MTQKVLRDGARGQEAEEEGCEGDEDEDETAPMQLDGATEVGCFLSSDTSTVQAINHIDHRTCDRCQAKLLRFPAILRAFL